MSMADKLQQLESASQTPAEMASFTTSPSGALVKRKSSMCNIQQLRDQVEGYVQQNRFLNQEILELNKLKQESNCMVDDMLKTCVNLETQYYDVHRKYLACLKELGKGQEIEEGGTYSCIFLLE